MRKAVAAGALIIGCSVFAQAAAPVETWDQNWFVRHASPIHRELKSDPGAGKPRGGSNSFGNNLSGNNSSGNNSPGNNPPGNNPPGNNLTGNNPPGNNPPGNNPPGNNPPGNGIWSDPDPGGTTGNGGGQTSGNVVAPEIDPASGVSALGLLSAALLMLRGRRTKLVAGLAAR
jgi:hypothetical protein